MGKTIKKGLAMNIESRKFLKALRSESAISRIYAIIIIAILGVAVVAAAYYFTLPSAPSEKVKLVVMRTGYPDRVEEIFETGEKAINPAFLEAHPNVEIDMIYCGWTEYWAGKLHTMIASGTAPDVVVISYDEFEYLYVMGALAPIDPYFPSSTYLEDNYAEAFAKSTVREGHAYGIPAVCGAYVLYYNRELFEQAGLDPDKPPQTWDEIVEYSWAIQNKTDAYGFGINGQYRHCLQRYWWSFRWSSEKENLFDPETGKPLFNNTAGVRSLQFLVDCIYKYKITQPDIFSYSASGVRPLFRDGVVAMFLGANYPLPMFLPIGDWSDPEKCWVGISTVPVDPEGDVPIGEGAGTVSSDCMVIMNQSKHAELAAEYILFATNKDNQAYCDLIYGSQPPRFDSAETEEFSKWYWLPFFESAKNSFGHHAIGFGTDAQKGLRYLYGQIFNAYKGKVTPKEALDKSVEDVWMFLGN